MARKPQQQASTNFDNSQDVLGQAKADSSQFGSNASQINSTLTPQLEQEASHPTGYGADDLAAMNTAVGQSTGGATAAVKGEAGLDALRTGNRGGLQTALDDSARSGMKTNADAALAIQGSNADLKQKQQQAGLSGLESLYGINSGDELNALGQENNSIGEGNQSVNAETNAGNSGWFQNMTNFLNSVKGAGSNGQGGFSV